MAFGSIEIATIARTQDYSTIKQNEDNKGQLMQSNISQHIQKDTQQRAQEVRSSDDAEWQNKRFDARDKGSNGYEGDGGRRRKKQSGAGQAAAKGRGGFDMKI